MKRIKLVAFDLVGTLIYPDPPVSQIYQSIGEAHGLRLDEVEIQRRFADAFRRSSFGCGSDIEHKGLWRAIVESVFRLESESCGPLFDQLWAHFAEPGAWQLFEDAQPAIEELQGNGFQVAIASNFDSRIQPILSGHGLWDDINVFWSSDLRASKPDQRFFQAIQSRLAVEADDCFMVGDSRVNDYQGAISAGWRAVWLDRSNAGQSAPSHTIGSLLELPTCLEHALTKR